MKTLIAAMVMLYLGASVAAAAPESPLAPVTFTTEQDHQNMMDQLRIKSLRPGRNGDEKAPGHANYDEAKANPYPDWPDLMTFRDGRKVTATAQWPARRAEIAEDFEREIYGRVPANAPRITWEAVAIEDEFISWKPVTATRLIGHAQSDGAITADIQAMLILPKTDKPVPVLIMLTWGNIQFPAPRQPSPEEAARIDAALKAELVARDPSLQAVFASHPGYQLVSPAPFPPPPGSGPEERIQQLIADGWGVALISPTSFQADDGSGLTRGVIGIANHGQPRRPDDWGALRAWGWGASRLLDYLETRPEVDAKHVGIEGVSRYGKAALVGMAFDERFAFVLVGSSGEGGAKPHRRDFGESVENLTSSGEYHWMAGNFLKYGGPQNAGDMPVDAHELIALCAPRLVFVSYGVPDQGDANWLDQQGSYMATVAAGPAWTLLGKSDLGVGSAYKTAKMPPVLTGLLDGELAWRQHDGGHTDAPNMATFVKWVDGKIGRVSTLP